MYLYLPTLAKSYLKASKNLVINWFLALSSVDGSPGLNLEWISINDSSVFLLASFSIVFNSNSFSPYNEIISSSLFNPIALKRVVIGTFLVLSILT